MVILGLMISLQPEVEEGAAPKEITCFLGSRDFCLFGRLTGFSSHRFHCTSALRPVLPHLVAINPHTRCYDHDHDRPSRNRFREVMGPKPAGVN